MEEELIINGKKYVLEESLTKENDFEEELRKEIESYELPSYLEWTFCELPSNKGKGVIFRLPPANTEGSIQIMKTVVALCEKYKNELRIKSGKYWAGNQIYVQIYEDY